MTRVLLDPGHGGMDSPGIVYGGIMEKDWVLEFCVELGMALRDHGFQVGMTRSGDEGVSLTQRGEIGESFGADLTLSVHVNGLFEDGKPKTNVSGLMTFILPDDALAGEVAAEVMERAPQRLRRRSRRAVVASPGDWTHRTYNVLRHHAGRCPVLVEAGFATNFDDVEMLTGSAHRAGLIACVLAGAWRFRELRPA